MPDPFPNEMGGNDLWPISDSEHVPSDIAPTVGGPTPWNPNDTAPWQSVSYGTLYEAVRNKLISLQASELTSNNVLISIEDEIYPKYGACFAQIVPGDFATNDTYFVGSGPEVGVEEASFRIRCCIRSMTDRADEDLINVISDDERKSIYAFAKPIKKALHGLLLEDEDGMPLTLTPIQYRTCGMLMRSRQARQWVRLDLVFQTSIISDYGDCVQ